VQKSSKLEYKHKNGVSVVRTAQWT